MISGIHEDGSVKVEALHIDNPKHKKAYCSASDYNILHQVPTTRSVIDLSVTDTLDTYKQRKQQPSVVVEWFDMYDWASKIALEY